MAYRRRSRGRRSSRRGRRMTGRRGPARRIGYRM